MVNGGEIESLTQIVTYDQPYELYETNKRGYTFTGYTLNNELFEANDLWDGIEDITLNATWKINVYTLSYYINNELVKSESVTYNSKFSIANIVYKNSYTAPVWDGDGVEFSSNKSYLWNYDYDLELNCKTLVYSGNDFGISSNSTDKTAVITCYYGSEINLLIPQKIFINDEIYEVVSIRSSAFQNCSSLISIEIPTSVTSIGDSAFYGCSRLTSITIPAGVTSIGYSAFYGCSSLISITLPFVGATLNGTSYTHFGYIFGASSYSYNSDYVPTSLKEVIITGGTKIGSAAFWGCSSLTSIVIPEGSQLTSIGQYAFEGCSSLTSIEIPNSVKSIGQYAFRDCSSLTTVTFEEGSQLTSIGQYAFEGCSSLESIIIPESVTSISYFAFWGCSSLTSIIVDENNKVFDSRNDCNAIIETSTNTLIIGCHNTVIPSSVISIGKFAFSGCSS